MDSDKELLLKGDDCEIFGWIFDYAAWMAWDEFQQNHTVDSRTERSFMTGNAFRLLLWSEWGLGPGDNA